MNREVIVYECDSDGVAADVERALASSGMECKRVVQARTLDVVLGWLDDELFGRHRTETDACPPEHTHVIADIDDKVVGSGESAHDATLAAIKSRIEDMHSTETALRIKLDSVAIAIQLLREVEAK